MRSATFLLSAITSMLGFMLCSCGTTKYVPDNEYLLKKNEISVHPKNKLPAASLSSYLRQQPNTTALLGWKLLLGIYNISPKSESSWSKFLKKIGEAPVLLDTTIIGSSIQNIDRYLTSQGYYNNIVSDSIAYKKKKATLHFNVTPGKQFKISSIKYFVPDSLIRVIYMPDSVHSLVKTGEILSEVLLDKESERASAFLRKYGYYNFNKTHVSFIADTLTGGNEAALAIYFKESIPDEIGESVAAQQRFKIQSIKVFSNWSNEQAGLDSGYIKKMDSLDYKGLRIYYYDKLRLRPGVIARVNRLQTGEYYNEHLVNTTYNRFSSLRLFSGVTLQFDAVAPKDTAASPTQVPSKLSDGALDCTVRLSPSKNQGYKLNLEASSNSSGLIGLSPAVSYFHKNIFRGGEWFTLGLMGNFQFKFNDPTKSTELGISTSVAFPTFLFPVPQRWFNNYTPGTDVGVSYNYQQRPEYTRNILSVSFGYNWRSGERLFFRYHPLQLNLVQLYNVDSTFYEQLNDPFLINSYQDHFDLGSSFTFYYTTDNTPMPKRSYFYYRWTTDVAGNVLSLFNRNLQKDSTGAGMLMGIAYSQYFKTDISAVYTWRLSPGQAITARMSGGIGVAYGNSKSLPFEKLFYAGGANSLRAWQARSVGPGSMPIDTTFSIPNQAGDIKLEANLEYRPKLFWKIEGAVFVDAGNIWTLRQEEGRESGAFKFNNFYQSIAVAGGAGLRLNLEFVLLRIDMGLKLRDPVQKRWLPFAEWFGRDTYAIQFGVGYPF